ncbi:putative scp-like extracellular protein [Zalerion maritima]|uniref:Scp-like extracellular protein n=1 Tax=Zalerion maritima TaxID=339359 RepID=A0AAD5RI63_9PEZI|nr:putative scp-like extracellular protein [Zalerion maritima]
MKVTASVFLAFMAISGVISGPLQKRAEVTTTTTETTFTTVTVDGPSETPTEAQTTAESETETEVETIAETTEGPAVTLTTELDTTTEEPDVPEETTDSTTESTEDTSEVETPSTSSTESSSDTTEETTPEETTQEATTTDTDSPSTSSGDSSDPVVSAALQHHNIHRANHSSADVTWDSDIAGYAAITAATCTFAHDTETGGGGYGQNIAMWASSDDVQATGKGVFIGRTITEMWYNGEINLFPSADYGMDTPDMSNFHAWGHYSQVIWADTTAVGCAVQYCEPGTMVDGMGAYYSVCNYSPAGNMGGGYADNVLPPQGLATYNAD